MPTDLSATAICATIIENTGIAIVSGDYEAFARHFVLPFQLETLDELRICKEESEFRSIFDAVHNRLTKQRVTLMARNCIAAEFRGPNTIIATHETRLISHNQLIEDPFPVMSIFERQPDAEWRSNAASYCVQDGSLYLSAFGA